MKKIYLFLFISIVAVVMIVISLMNFNSKVESWSSVFAGAAVGLLIIKFPTITAYLKSKKQKDAK